MIFLLKGEIRKDVSISKVKLLELAAKQLEKVLEYKRSGQVMGGGGFIDRSGSYTIWELESPEKFVEILRGLPLYEHAIWEFTPLISLEYNLDLVKRTLADKTKENALENEPAS